MQATQESWEEEQRAAYLYRVMAEVESEHDHRVLFARLAEEAEAQAGIWAKKIREQGGELPLQALIPWRVRLAAGLIRRLGPRRLQPMLAAMKVRGLSVYRGPKLRGHPMPTSAEDVGHRHRGIDGGGNLRAAVFGVNDGLVSNTSLILGVAGATAEPGIVLLSGIAGLLAGAFSMAAGEYVSVRSQRELYEYQIGLEREELDLYPAEEAEEMALIYNARGVPMDDARRIALEIIKDPVHALDTLAREELGLNPDELGSPWGAALASFTAFAAGAMVPLLPFAAGLSAQAVPVAAGLAMLALFAVGASMSLFTGRSALWSGLRMVLIGGGAGLVTYLIGTVLGVTLA
jgi:vacuolar iron transporter family protein